MSEHLTDHVLRARLMDLSFSLYDSLGDFLTDFVYLDGTDDPHDALDDVFTRLNVASMNCLADIELIYPILVSIRNTLDATTRH